jgi:hypothetical protein
MTTITINWHYIWWALAFVATFAIGAVCGILALTVVFMSSFRNLW